MNIKIKDSIRTRENGEDILLFDIETELLHRINYTGYKIIKLIEEGKNLLDIRNILVSEFPDLKEKIEKELIDFFLNLEEKDIIQVVPKKVYNNIYLYDNGIGSFTYYIEGDKKLLVDAGSFVRKPVDMIIITHCHFDHILFINELKKFNNCKIACGGKEVEAIEKLNEKVILEKSPRKLKPCKIDNALREGDKIHNKNFEFEILETPGHTEGSISIFERKKKILFPGDTWFGNDNQGKWIYPSGNREESKNTLERLKKLNPKYIFPGHKNIVLYT